MVLVVALIGTTLAAVSARGQASSLRSELSVAKGDLASAKTTSGNLSGELNDVQNELRAARRHATTCERGLDGLVKVTLSLIKSGRRQSREGAFNSLLAAAFMKQANDRYHAAKPAIQSCKNGPPEGVLS
jgi:hypothetical protein